MSPDGRLLLYSTFSEKGTGVDVWVRVGEGASAVARPLLEREHDQGQALLSPDQGAIAYVSNESGPNEVFVTWFHVDPAAGTVSTSESIRISEGGGFSPRWRSDGRELFHPGPGRIGDGYRGRYDTRIPAGRREAAVHGAGRATGVGRGAKWDTLPVRRAGEPTSTLPRHS